MQNSTAVFQLNFSNKTSFCALKPARTQSPETLVAMISKKTHRHSEKKYIFDYNFRTEFYILGLLSNVLITSKYTHMVCHKHLNHFYFKELGLILSIINLYQHQFVLSIRHFSFFHLFLQFLILIFRAQN